VKREREKVKRGKREGEREGGRESEPVRHRNIE
jgi:hypothetical protein